MLVLTRKRGEEILIGPDIRIRIEGTKRATLRIEAPDNVLIMRREVLDAIRRDGQKHGGQTDAQR